MAFKLRGVLALGAIGAVAFACLGSTARGQCIGYSVASGGPGTFTPGTQDLGLYIDDGTIGVTLPFNVDLYGTSFGSATVSSNGTLQFTTNNASYTNNCLPSATFAGPTIFPFWDDLYTASQANGLGIFTDLSGPAGSRQFVIEWRTTYCCTAGVPINDFEVKFYENQAFFDVIYSTPMGDRCSATIGVQDGAGNFTQFSCNTAGGAGCVGAPASGLSLRFACITSATAGACCNPAAGTCGISSSAACTGAGNFQGVGVTCPATCPQPGACCNTTSGACTQTGAAGCTSPSTFSGPGSPCTPNPCTGACCNPATGVCTTTTASGCAAPNAFQGLGVVCAAGLCPQPPTGACCRASTLGCTEVFAATCATQGGTYNGDNTTCGASSCPFGACCSGGGCAGCSVTVSTACSGVFGGNGSTCAAACPNDGYTIAPAPTTVTFNPGVDDIGNHCDDCATSITLPFPVNIYGAPFSSASVVSNGFVQFTTTAATFTNACLPTAVVNGPAIFPFWDDQRTDTVAGSGIFTTTTGTAPDRTFVIEWRTYYFATAPAAFTQNHELILYEGRNFFDVLYGATFADRSSATIGVQAGGTAGSPSSQFVCNAAGPAADSGLRFSCGLIQPPGGVCCRGATCSTTASQASCTPSGLAGAAFVSSASACNSGPLSSAPCCYANYNKVGGISVQDIFDFLGDWFGSSPLANTGGNGSGGTLSVQNIFDFLSDWFTGGCT